jgi:DNA-directed RNA polymerase specialized sigma24 family protein
MSTDDDISTFVAGIFDEYVHTKIVFDPSTSLSADDNLFVINKDSFRIREIGLSAERHEAEVLAWLSEHDYEHEAQEEEERVQLIRKYDSWCEKARRDETVLATVVENKLENLGLSADIKEDLETVISRIPPQHSIYFVLKYIDRLENAQIAALEDVPISVVRKRVKNAVSWVKIIVAELANTRKS